MKRFFLIPIAALLLVCLSFSSCSKEDRQNAAMSILGDLMEVLTGDSVTYLCGTWAYASMDGKEIDTLWFYPDSTVLNHYISKDDQINIQQSGGYIYYKFAKQVLISYTHGYNYMTKKDLVDWNQTAIYGVKKFKFSIANMNRLTVDELDQTTGEVTGSVSYDYVGPAE